MSLPFLKDKKPIILMGKPTEARFGFSEDEELAEDAMKELLDAIETDNHKKLMQSISALVEIIRNKNAADAQ